MSFHSGTIGKHFLQCIIISILLPVLPSIEQGSFSGFRHALLYGYTNVRHGGSYMQNFYFPPPGTGGPRWPSWHPDGT